MKANGRQFTLLGTVSKVYRSRRVGIAVTVIAALAVVSCSSSNSSTFQPTGSMSPAGPPSASEASTSNVGGFNFPAGFTVQFNTAPPSGASEQSVIQALEDQQAGLVYTLYVEPGDTRYLEWTESNTAAAFEDMVHTAQTSHASARGVIQYSDIELTSSIYTFPSGSGTSGTFCLDTSGAHSYNTRTGKAVSPVIPGGFYTFSMHKDPGGTWKVASLQKGGASSCGS
jgi:hypothetical protein